MLIAECQEDKGAYTKLRCPKVMHKLNKTRRASTCSYTTGHYQIEIAGRSFMQHVIFESINAMKGLSCRQPFAAAPAVRRVNRCMDVGETLIYSNCRIPEVFVSSFCKYPTHDSSDIYESVASTQAVGKRL